MKRRTVDVHRNVLDCVFYESWHSESHALLKGVKAFLSVFSIFCLIWMKFGKRDLNIILLSTCEFRENRIRGGSIFLRGVMKLYLCVYRETV
jgi:hypothetical protein